MVVRLFVLSVLLCASAAAQAQQYRWVDEKGRLHYSDTPPAKAKDVRKTDVKTESPAEDRQQVPFELQQAQKDFPVTLYTAPVCKQPCELARMALNKRGVPFAEVQVWNPETLEQLKSRAGSDNVPALVVGRSTLSGFDQTRYDGLLDSAGYPKQGALAARSQRAPAPPEGYEPPPLAEPLRPEAAAPAKPGPYDPSGLKSNQSGKPGPYLVPGSAN
jgi:glutaredoxin